MSISQQLLEQSIHLNIQQALHEDIGDGDITALLTPEDTVKTHDHQVKKQDLTHNQGVEEEFSAW